MGNSGSSNADGGGGGSSRRGRRGRGGRDDRDDGSQMADRGGDRDRDRDRDDRDRDRDRDHDRDRDRKGGDRDKDRKRRDDYSDSDSDDEKDRKRRDDKRDGGGAGGGAAKADEKQGDRYQSNMSVLTPEEQKKAQAEAERGGLLDGGGDVEAGGWNVDQILAKQRERKKRDDETKRELARRFEKVRHPFYGEENSAEKCHAFWSVGKTVWYCALMAYGASIGLQNFGQATCTAWTHDASMCLLSNCVNVAEGGTCLPTACDINKAGCLNGSCVSDFSQWQRDCKNTATCPQATIEAAQAPVLASAMLFIAGLILEILVFAANWLFATLHQSEFAELHCIQSCFLVGVLKSAPQLSQLLLLVEFVLGIYALYVYYTVARPACQYAVTNFGDPITFSTDLERYILALMFTLVVGTLIGWWVRKTYRHRGELFFPSNVESGNVPGDLDCASCRALDKPRLCHDPVRNCIQPEDDGMGMGDENQTRTCGPLIGGCCAVLCDSIFCVCCYPCGICIGGCCRWKAEIAP